jgi:hypothetical protein
MPYCGNRLILLIGNSTDCANIHSMSFRLKMTFERFKKRVGRLPYLGLLVSVHQEIARLRASNFFIPSEPWLHGEDLAALAKYAVLYSADTSTPPILKIAPALNGYKKFWKEAEELNPYADDDKSVAMFILRLVYQQVTFLVYQPRLPQLLARTKQIFTIDDDLRKAVESLAGMEVSILTELAESVYNLFAFTPTMSAPALRRSLPEHLRPHLDSYLKFQSGTRSEFRLLCNATKAIELAERPYEFNPLLRFPLLYYEEGLVAPFPELLIYGATRGLFFRLGEIGKSQYFGRAFEQYACQLVAEAVGSPSVLTEAEERKLGWEGKTNDFTVISGDVALLFECKTSALFSEGKRAASVDAIRRDIHKNLVNSKERAGLFQLYDKIHAIKSQQLPAALTERYKGVQYFFPVILLYDYIQHANADQVLGNLLRSELSHHGIVNFDFQIWHIEELEDLLGTISADDLLSAIEEKFSDPRYRQWDLDTYLHTRTGIAHFASQIFVPNGKTKALDILTALAAAEPHIHR